MNEDSFTHQNSDNDDCGEGEVLEIIKEEINEEESVDDPLSIHQDNENKEEDMYDYDRIDIEEFKIEPDSNVNEIEYKDESDQNNVNAVNNLLEINNVDEEVVDNIEENVDEVEGNVVDQGNNDFSRNSSVAEALAFFSS